MHIPIFSTERLVLRPLRTEDAGDLYAYAQDELVARPGMWEPYDSLEACKADLELMIGQYEHGFMWWALEHRANGRVIGRIQLSAWSARDARAELSYALSHSYWAKGLMTEAVQPVVEYGWRQLDLHRLSATVVPSNVPSARILRRIGMEREGCLRHFRRLWGEWVDVDVYAVLAT